MTDLINTAEETTTETMETNMTNTEETTTETTMETTEENTVEETAAKVDRRHENPGRKPTFSDKWNIIDALVEIRAADLERYHYNNDGATLSRVHVLQLVEMGFVETFKLKVTEGRGRAKTFYKVSGKGKSQIALSKRWKRETESNQPTENTVEENTGDLVMA